MVRNMQEKIKKKDYKPKLAVMPFSNMNNDEDSWFFSDGIVRRFNNRVLQGYEN